MTSLVVADAWMWSPFVMLLLLAGLDSVPAYLIEAAEIDRASRWRRFWTVIFPAVRGVLLLALLFRTIELFNMFDLIYTITNGGPGVSTESVSTEIYDTAFVLFESGRASALGNLSVFRRDRADAHLFPGDPTAEGGGVTIQDEDRPVIGGQAGLESNLDRRSGWACLLLAGHLDDSRSVQDASGCSGDAAEVVLHPDPRALLGVVSSGFG